MPRTQSSGSAHRRFSAAFTIVAGLFLSASILNAQTRALQDGSETTQGLLFSPRSPEAELTSLAHWKPAVGLVSTGRNMRFGASGRSRSETDGGILAATNRQQPAFPKGTSTKRTSGQRKALGAVRGGGVLGFILGSR